MTEALPDSLYIGGRWQKPASGGTDEVLNPATEALVGIVPLGDTIDAGRALDAARHAFDEGSWPRMSALERQVALGRLLDAVEARRERIVSLLIAEAGATAMQAEFVHYALPMKHARATLALMMRDPVTMHTPETTPQRDGTTMLGISMSVRQPVGVIAAITAYNFPFFLNMAKTVPALAAGCTLVLKPSPYTPFSALLLAEAAEEAGIPAGVFNVVNGDASVGEMLTTDSRVDLVTFTGSDKVGSAIQAQAAPTLKRVVMELGGKSAMIVRPDADLDAAVMAGLLGFTLHSGQGCALLTRQLVHNSVRADYVERLGALARSVKVGDPRDPASAMGPLIREVARKRSEDFVSSAIAEGGTLVAGGGRPKGLDRGFFFEPTLIDNVKNHHRIAQEEIFGPVGIVIGFDDDDEAIALANDSDYGLGGGIFSRDVGKAYEMALALRTGNVSINGGSGSMSSQAPFGGVKRSGQGKEYGLEGLNEFTYIKAISFHAG